MALRGRVRTLLAGDALPPNRCRHPTTKGGHLESYFLRLNDPVRPRALWLKATILAPVEGPAVAEAWAVLFDADAGRTFAHRETRPLAEATFEGDEPLCIDVAGCAFSLAPDGSARGALVRGAEACDWDFTWKRDPSPVAEPLCLLPLGAMVDGPFPRSKLLTPLPSLVFSGRVTCLGEAIDVTGWRGMQGHNWGREHAFEYAWGQCLFPAGADGPDAMVEAFSARLRLAGRTTPRLSAMVVRRGDRTYRFDRIFDFWRQEAQVSDRRWDLRLGGPDGTARLVLDGGERPWVCLGYRNPAGPSSYCLNTKLAQATLEVAPAGEKPFTLASPHGGALELLRRTPDPRLPEVV